MILKSLRLENFRNYAAAEFCWDEQVNLICGKNAQGKSNLLEAVCYLGMASSFRGATEQELIRHQADYFYLAAEAATLCGQLRITAAADRHGRRRWTGNRQSYQRLAGIGGLFHPVIFAPEDIYLVKAGPDARRRYLNRQMSQLDRAYCRLLLSYNHALRQRNACLKQWEEKPDQEQLAIWSERLATLGGAVSAARQDIVARLQPLAAELHAQLSGGETLELRYQSTPAVMAAGADAAAAAEALQAEFRRLQQSELRRGLTLAGPHRDELLIRLEGRTARDFASQGQQRTAALSLKLAELELAHTLRGEYPVLLLDDVFSELDADRCASVLRYAGDRAQTFISAVDERQPLPAGKRFLISAGQVCG